MPAKSLAQVHSCKPSVSTLCWGHVSPRGWYRHGCAEPTTLMHRRSPSRMAELRFPNRIEALPPFFPYIAATGKCGGFSGITRMVRPQWACYASDLCHHGNEDRRRVEIEAAVLQTFTSAICAGWPIVDSTGPVWKCGKHSTPSTARSTPASRQSRSFSLRGRAG